MVQQVRAELTKLLSLRASKEKLAEQIYQQHRLQRESFLVEFHQLVDGLIEPEFIVFRDWVSERGVACYVLRHDDASAPHHLPFISFGLGAPPNAGVVAKGDLIRVQADAIRREVVIAHFKRGNRAGVSPDEASFYLADITPALLSHHLSRVMAPYYGGR